MSLFSSQTTWPPQCLSANQSPINLSQSSAKPCEITCDLVMDDDYISQATVSVSDEGMILTSTSLGSCKFRGESYVAQALSINHPSHHTLDGVQADGEITIFFKKPTGELLCVSALFRVNPSQTSSYTFFKQFVPYGVSTGDTPIKLQNWSLGMMVPPSSSYYTYSGSTLVPPCAPCEWVVFRSMINMDQDDFAYLVRNSQAGSRSLSAQGSRDVFFNDNQNLSGIMPNDGKMYLRLKPTGNTAPTVNAGGSRVDLKVKKTAKEQEDEDKNPTTLIGKSRKAIGKHIDSNGGYIGTLEFWLIIVAITAGCYYGYTNAKETPLSTEFIKPASEWTRNTFGELWNFLASIPGIIYNWTIGFIIFITKPRPKQITEPVTLPTPPTPST